MYDLMKPSPKPMPAPQSPRGEWAKRYHEMVAQGKGMK